MKIKTQDLIGRPLDWVMAKLLAHEWRCPWLLEQEGYAAWISYERAWGNPHPAYSTEGDTVIEIMEQEKISGGPSTPKASKDVCWCAYGEGWEGPTLYGPTLRIAVCRAFVASKLGDEVDVPKELMS